MKTLVLSFRIIYYGILSILVFYSGYSLMSSEKLIEGQAFFGGFITFGAIMCAWLMSVLIFLINRKNKHNYRMIFNSFLMIWMLISSLIDHFSIWLIGVLIISSLILMWEVGGRLISGNRIKNKI